MKLIRIQQASKNTIKAWRNHFTCGSESKGASAVTGLKISSRARRVGFRPPPTLKICLNTIIDVT